MRRWRTISGSILNSGIDRALQNKSHRFHVQVQDSALLYCTLKTLGRNNSLFCDALQNKSQRTQVQVRLGLRNTPAYCTVQYSLRRGTVL